MEGGDLLNIKRYLPYFIIISLLLADIIIYLGLFKLFGLDSTLVAGFLGFIGALIGGLITFLGVKLTLKEQRKLLKIMKLIKKYMN